MSIPFDTTLVAVGRSFKYNKCNLSAGDEFQARETDAKVLIALRHARPKDEPTEPKVIKRSRIYQRRDMQAEG